MPPLDVARLLAFDIPDLRDPCEAEGAILYALGVGAGLSPDLDEQAFIFEDNLHVLPTMAFVLGTRGFWPMVPETGLDWQAILHGEQSLFLNRPLRLGEMLHGSTKVIDLADKGTGKAALIRAEKTLRASTGEIVATAAEVWVARGAGGFGGPRDLPGDVLAVEVAGPADVEVLLPTSLSQAATYRLSGDRNPLHIDSGLARRAGFERPILHGLSTLGVIGRALVHEVCGGEPARLSGLRTRFTAPVYPGEMLQIMIWYGAKLRFRCHVRERNVLVAEGEASLFDRREGSCGIVEQFDE